MLRCRTIGCFFVTLFLIFSKGSYAHEKLEEFLGMIDPHSCSVVPMTDEWKPVLNGAIKIYTYMRTEHDRKLESVDAGWGDDAVDVESGPVSEHSSGASQLDFPALNQIWRCGSSYQFLFALPPSTLAILRRGGSKHVVTNALVVKSINPLEYRRVAVLMDPSKLESGEEEEWPLLPGRASSRGAPAIRVQEFLGDPASDFRGDLVEPQLQAISDAIVYGMLHRHFTATDTKPDNLLLEILERHAIPTVNLIDLKTPVYTQAYAGSKCIAREQLTTRQAKVTCAARALVTTLGDLILSRGALNPSLLDEKEELLRRIVETSLAKYGVLSKFSPNYDFTVACNKLLESAEGSGGKDELRHIFCGIRGCE